MARIDVKTLVLAFEKRIEALEKNPPDKVSTAVIINLLENSIDDIIKGHFLALIQKELEVKINNEFHQMKDEFTSKTIIAVLTDEEFRNRLENKLKSKLLESF